MDWAALCHDSEATLLTCRQDLIPRGTFCQMASLCVSAQRGCVLGHIRALTVFSFPEGEGRHKQRRFTKNLGNNTIPKGKKFRFSIH